MDILLLITHLPSLVFHLAAQGLTLKHCFASRAVKDLAVDLLASSNHRVDSGALAQAYEKDPRLTEKAVLLLIHCDFVRVRTKEGAPELVHTLKWESLAEETVV